MKKLNIIIPAFILASLTLVFSGQVYGKEMGKYEVSVNKEYSQTWGDEAKTADYGVSVTTPNGQQHSKTFGYRYANTGSSPKRSLNTSDKQGDFYQAQWVQGSHQIDLQKKTTHKTITIPKKPGA